MRVILLQQLLSRPLIPATTPLSIASAVRAFRSAAHRPRGLQANADMGRPHIHACDDITLFLHEEVPRFRRQDLLCHELPCIANILAWLNRPEVPTINTSAPAAISF
jgi:hypothetical protein